MIDTRYRNTVAEIVLLSMILMAGLTLYLSDLDKSSVFVIYSGSLLLVVVLILSAFDNMLFAARLLLLFLVGAYPLAIKLLGENLYFSVFEFGTQTLDIATTMYALSLIAVVGAYIGWKAGNRASSGASSSAARDTLPEFDDYYCWIFYLATFFTICSGYLIVSSSTGTILDSAYGSGTEGVPVIGSASAIGGICLSVMFYCGLIARKKIYSLIIVLAAIYLLVWCQILRGLRQDVVGALFSCMILYLVFELKNVSLKLKYILYLLPLFLLLELWGLIRTGLSLFLAGRVSITELFDMGLGNAAVIPGVVYSGTLGPIATTFANVVALFKRNSIDFLYGSGYFDYLLRTPPEFLYPDRPQDYAMMFPKYGLSSGGGFFELAEAYLNFGLAGAFFIPLLISFVIAFVYSRARKNFGIFYIFLLSSILCVWLRGAWYQTFAFYKSFVSAIFLYCVIHWIAVFFTRTRRPAVFAERPGD